MDAITFGLSGPAQLRAQFFPRHKVGLSDVAKVIDLSVSRMSRRHRAGRLSLKIPELSSNLTTRDGRIQILEGHAGAGKSTALVPVRYALEASGFDVIGPVCRERGPQVSKKILASRAIPSRASSGSFRDTIVRTGQRPRRRRG